MLTIRGPGVEVQLLSSKLTKKLELDIKKHNEQYPIVRLKRFSKSHDRFLVIDNKEVYHLGASLKDLGKKWFAFSKLDFMTVEFLIKIQG